MGSFRRRAVCRSIDRARCGHWKTQSIEPDCAATSRRLRRERRPRERSANFRLDGETAIRERLPTASSVPKWKCQYYHLREAGWLPRCKHRSDVSTHGHVLTLIDRSAGHDRSDHARCFVGQRHCGDTCGLSRHEMSEPRIGSIRLIFASCTKAVMPTMRDLSGY